MDERTVRVVRFGTRGGRHVAETWRMVQSRPSAASRLLMSLLVILVGIPLALLLLLAGLAGIVVLLALALGGAVVGAIASVLRGARHAAGPRDEGRRNVRVREPRREE